MGELLGREKELMAPEPGPGCSGECVQETLGRRSKLDLEIQEESLSFRRSRVVGAREGGSSGVAHPCVCGGESGCGEIWRQEEGLEERRWRSRGPGDGWGVENPGAELRC